MATATGKPAATESPAMQTRSARWYRTTHKSQLTTWDGGRPSTVGEPSVDSGKGRVQARGNISSGRPRTFAHLITSSNACWPNGRATHMLQTDHSRIRCSTNDSRHKTMTSTSINHLPTQSRGRIHKCSEHIAGGTQCSSVRTSTIRQTANA